jgi:hypothetical protein
MSGNLDILLLEVLRRLDAKVGGLADQVRDLTHRVTTLEHQLGGLAATEALHHACTAVRLDRVNACLDRIERRPDRIAPPGAG